MNMQQIYYHRLHGAICITLGDATDKQLDEMFSLFLMLDFDDKLAIEELCIYHNCSELYTRIRQWRAETGTFG